MERTLTVKNKRGKSIELRSYIFPRNSLLCSRKGKGKYHDREEYCSIAIFSYLKKGDRQTIKEVSAMCPKKLSSIAKQ